MLLSGQRPFGKGQRSTQSCQQESRGVLNPSAQPVKKPGWCRRATALRLSIRVPPACTAGSEALRSKAFLTAFAARRAERVGESCILGGKDRACASFFDGLSRGVLNPSAAFQCKVIFTNPPSAKGAVWGSGAQPLVALATCQMVSLYSAMVRSEEKKPDLAVLMTAILSHLSRSR